MFTKDRYNYIPIGLAVLFNIIHWLILLIKVKPSGINMLLHYNVIYGSDWVAKGYYFYLIPGVALVLFLVNLAYSIRVYSREKIAAYFLNFSSLAVQIIFFVATIILAVANEQ